jgi:hypothetical protein
LLDRIAGFVYFLAMQDQIHLKINTQLIGDLMETTGSNSAEELLNRALSLLKSASQREADTPVQSGTKKLTVEQFVKREYALSNIRIKERIVLFLLIAYGMAIAATFLLFYLRGFGLVALSLTEMKWLGGAVVGELAGLFAIVIKSVFPR